MAMLRLVCPNCFPRGNEQETLADTEEEIERVRRILLSRHSVTSKGKDYLEKCDPSISLVNGFRGRVLRRLPPHRVSYR